MLSLNTGNDGSILTTWERSGWSVFMQVDGDVQSISDCGDYTYSDITFKMVLSPLSDGAMLPAFRITNLGPIPRIVDIAVDGVLGVDGQPETLVAAYENGQYPFISGGDYGFTWIARNYPLVRDFSIYSFGESAMLTGNMWEQVADEQLTGIQSGLAFSWQDLIAPTGHSVVVSTIVRAGRFIVAAPVLKMDESTIPPQIRSSDKVRLGRCCER
jgi:hypothetical protein